MPSPEAWILTLQTLVVSSSFLLVSRSSVPAIVSSSLPFTPVSVSSANSTTLISVVATVPFPWLCERFLPGGPVISVITAALSPAIV